MKPTIENLYSNCILAWNDVEVVLIDWCWKIPFKKQAIQEK